MNDQSSYHRVILLQCPFVSSLSLAVIKLIHDLISLLLHFCILFFSRSNMTLVECVWLPVEGTVPSSPGEPKLDAFLSVGSLSRAGLASDDDIARLFCRQEVLDLWDALMKTEHAIQVEGAPGTGKSCTVWAWACYMCDVMGKTVTWAHLEKTTAPLCLQMTATTVMSLSDPDANLVKALKTSDSSIVILDGVVSASETHSSYVRSVFDWQSNCDRVAVVVSSQAGKHNFEAEERLQISLFQMFPWTLEQYERACEDVQFFTSIEKYLSDGKAEPIADVTRQEKLEHKYFYAGGSARWMFGKGFSSIINLVKLYLDTVGDVMALLRGVVGERSRDSVNHLMMSFPGKGGFRRKFFVSEYVAGTVLKEGGSEAVKIAYQLGLFLKNPAYRGWVVEQDFVQQLDAAAKSGQSLALKDQNGSSVSISANGGVTTFSPEHLSAVKPLLQSGSWLRPERYNEAGYDLVRLERENDTLTFLQVTQSLTHSLKLNAYSNMTTLVLEEMGDAPFSRVDIIMVVPDESLGNFTITAGKVSYKGYLSDWQVAYPTVPGEKWRKGHEHEQVRVLGFQTTDNLT
jgi:hypothetical protein